MVIGSRPTHSSPVVRCTQGELVRMELVTGETGEAEWQPKKVFFS
jgi:hypothetical protein